MRRKSNPRNPKLSFFLRSTIRLFSSFISTLSFANSSRNRFFNAGTIQLCRAWERYRKLPEVLSPEEVVQMIDSASNLFHRTMLMTLYSTGRDGSRPIHRRDRHVDIWRRNKEGNWKLWMYMDNQDVADSFRPDQATSAGAQTHGSF